MGVTLEDVERAHAAALPAGALPLATYRVQLTPNFGFLRLAEIVPYFAQRGVSHVSLSPCLEAVSGSLHGYDVTDPTRVRTDFGGESAMAVVFESCAAHGLSILLDMVPNRMAASPAHNPWRRDRLRWERSSPYAAHYDVDWTRHSGEQLGSGGEGGLDEINYRRFFDASSLAKRGRSRLGAGIRICSAPAEITSRSRSAAGRRTAWLLARGR
jgi:maltooligosyltrehalose synthase